MTTTNGTPLFAAAAKAELVVATALVNISPVAQKVADENRDVVIACAGREGNFSIEDTICGGMLIHLLGERHGQQLHLNDAGSLALLLYQNSRNAIRQSIEEGEHGQFLASLGFSKDVERAALIDAMPVIPVLKDGRLVPHVDN
jgi:2-phosphosulfolactate phosphatase